MKLINNLPPEREGYIVSTQNGLKTNIIKYIIIIGVYFVHFDKKKNPPTYIDAMGEAIFF